MLASKAPSAALELRREIDTVDSGPPAKVLFLGVFQWSPLNLVFDSDRKRTDLPKTEAMSAQVRLAWRDFVTVHNTDRRLGCRSLWGLLGSCFMEGSENRLKWSDA